MDFHGILTIGFQLHSMPFWGRFSNNQKQYLYLYGYEIELGNAGDENVRVGVAQEFHHVLGIEMLEFWACNALGFFAGEEGVLSTGDGFLCHSFAESPCSD